MKELPIGCIFCYPSPICPEGFLPCDGRELSKKEYPELYALIKDTWGETKNSFFLPDLQGQFIRGWDKDGNTDPARHFGSIQDDALQGHGHISSCTANGEHHHSLEYSGEALGQAKPKYCEWKNWVVRCLKDPIWHYSENRFSETEKQGSHSHTITIDSPKDSSFGRVKIATETRPKNIALMYCIKVK